MCFVFMDIDRWFTNPFSRFVALVSNMLGKKQNTMTQKVRPYFDSSKSGKPVPSSGIYTSYFHSKRWQCLFISQIPLVFRKRYICKCKLLSIYLALFQHVPFRQYLGSFSKNRRLQRWRSLASPCPIAVHLGMGMQLVASSKWDKKSW